jgi:hypothetical protein
VFVSIALNKSFLSIAITIIIMGTLVTIILNLLKATSMQISVWIWELRMIARYGFDWSFKDRWGRF